MAFNKIRDTRTWIEISKKAAAHNVKILRSLLGGKVKLYCVVKSNAYGHGIFAIPPVFSKSGVDGFCVDSLIEGIKLREARIKESILVLGLTLPHRFHEAAKHDIAITISSIDALKNAAKLSSAPKFHLKIDTGMHRQGIYPEDIPKAIKLLNNKRFALCDSFVGVYTHFASAKDINYPSYTDLQLDKFLRAVKIFENAGYRNLIRHASATGATLINKKYHLDAVRVGIGLYGLWPSKELEMQITNINFKPVLSWHSVVGEIKNFKKGDYIGYDLVEKTAGAGKLAVVPIGYWHGFPRALSGSASVLVRGARAKVLGRVSMDMIVVDVTNISAKIGDEVTIIGKQNKENIPADELARLSGTSQYEIVTRINPLIERIVTE